MPELSIHWRFALGNAVHALERLVFNFDFDAEAQDHAYSSVPEPTELLLITNGFLQESNHFFEGDVSRLKRISQQLSEPVIPTYELGKQQAVTIWQTAQPQKRQMFGAFSFEDFREEAKRQAPASASLSIRSWFIEGFCRQWQKEWIQYKKQS